MKHYSSPTIIVSARPKAMRTADFTVNALFYDSTRGVLITLGDWKISTRGFSER